MRKKFRRFLQGLWLTPAEDECPDGSLRRGRGVHPIKTASLRSRNGLSTLHSLNAHSITRFNDVMHYGVGTAFYRATTSKKTGLSGDRLNFTPMPPTAETEDYLFVTGGDELFKISPSGTVSNWGIDQPDTSTMTATAQNAYTKVIDDFEQHNGYAVGYKRAHERWKNASNYDSTEGKWSDRGEATVIVQEDSRALWLKSRDPAISLLSSCAYNYFNVRGGELDLTTFGGGVDSLDTDFIVFWIRMNRADLWEWFQLDFSCGEPEEGTSGYFGKGCTVYSARVVPDSDEATGSVAIGPGDLTEYTTPESERKWMEYATAGRASNINSASAVAIRTKKLEQKEISGKFSALAIPKKGDVWLRVRLAKNVFDKYGDSASTATWANVRCIRFSGYRNSVNTTDITQIYIDNMYLDGGVGMQGTYQYAVTFRNSTTGHRSNAGDDVVTVEDVDRGGVALANIPTSTDSQVNQREIWRTIGGGTLFWLVDRINNNTTTTYTDTVADPDQDFNRTNTVLTAEELPLDNDEPYSTFIDCAYHLGAAFWIDDHDGRKGNVYYSPTGRVESMKGYVRVTNDDDPLKRLFRWNDALYVMSESSIFRVDGSYPYVARKVYGCPGTTKPHTVAVSSEGVLYEADNGVRLFNGMTSQLVNPEAIQSVFRGEDSGTYGQITSFSGVVAAAGREEYFISDGSQTLALHLKDKTWRDVGVGYNALHYAWDAAQLYGTHSSVVYEAEKEGVYADGGAAFTFDMMPHHILLDEEKDLLILRVHIDCDTNTETLAATIYIDTVAYSLGNISNASRQVTTYPVGRYGKRVSVRLNGIVDSQVTVYGIELDVSDPGEVMR